MLKTSIEEKKGLLESINVAKQKVAAKISACKVVKGIAKVGEYAAGVYTFIKLAPAIRSAPSLEIAEKYSEIALERFAKVLPEAILGMAVLGGCALVSYAATKLIENGIEKYYTLRDASKEVRDNLEQEQREVERDAHLYKNDIFVPKTESYEEIIAKTSGIANQKGAEDTNVEEGVNNIESIIEAIKGKSGENVAQNNVEKEAPFSDGQVDEKMNNNGVSQGDEGNQ